MRKKKSKSMLPKLLKKSSLGGLILVLLTAIFTLGESFKESAPIVLPACNHPVELYSNQAQDDLSNLHLTAIKSAKQSVTLVIYSLIDQQIIAALQEKCHEGIPVHIVCDAKASLGIGRKLQGANIVKRISQGLMHQKILIIDQKHIVLGSANMTHDSLRVHGNLVMALENPPLAELMTAKILSMDEEGKHTPLMNQKFKSGGQDIELWELPDDQEAANRVIQLLRTAKKTIKVAMYTWTRRDFTQELINAANRGVKVEAVIDRYSGKGASAKIVEMLERGGIPVHLSTGQGLLHYKFAYIDEKILINGSANWTAAAFKDNDDCFLVIQPLTSQQKNKMNDVWKNVWQRSAPRKSGIDSVRKSSCAFQ
jgi:phosphatidylserine/phosphatidylglycerophosphate/cardiolipin synthase-like enzyme